MSRLAASGAKWKFSNASVSVAPAALSNLVCTESRSASAVLQAWYIAAVRYSMKDKICALYRLMRPPPVEISCPEYCF